MSLKPAVTTVVAPAHGVSTKRSRRTDSRPSSETTLASVGTPKRLASRCSIPSRIYLPRVRRKGFPCPRRSALDAISSTAKRYSVSVPADELFAASGALEQVGDVTAAESVNEVADVVLVAPPVKPADVGEQRVIRL